MPEQKPRTSLPYIIHQADLMAARIEFEKEWLLKFNKINLEEPKKNFTLDNNKKIKPEEIPENSWCKMILEVYAIWVNGNNDFGIFLRPILISFKQREEYNYKFIDTMFKINQKVQTKFKNH